MNKRFLFKASTLAAACALACALHAAPRPAQGASFYGLIRKGNRFYKNDLFREAIGYYVKGGEKSPKAVEPPFNAGAALYKSEDYVRSIDALAQALGSAKKPELQSNILYNMGNCSYQLGDFGKAAEYYRKGLELTPYDLNLKYNLELALKKLEAKNEEEAESGKGGGMGKKADSPGSGSPGSGDDREKTPEEGQKRPAGGESAESDRRNNESGAAGGEKPEPTQGGLSREEAERLLRSVNSDQSQIVGDYIKQKLGMSENEKDW